MAAVRSVTSFERLIPPSRLGTVVDSYQSPTPGAPLIVQIQDLHANYEVQTHIAGLLEFLDRRMPGPYQVGLEGAEGAISVAELGRFPGKTFKAKVCDTLMKAAELTGPEYFAIVNGKPDLLWGVENERYHKTNVELFRSTFFGKEALALSLDKLTQDLEPVKRRYYGRDLRNLDQQLRLAVDDDANRLERTQLQRSRTETQRALIQVSRDLDLLKRFVREQVTPEEVRRQVPALEQITGRIQAALDLAGVSYDKENLAETVSGSLDFYAVALLRDNFLAENTLQLLKTQRSAVLVAGGFHTPGISRLLKEKGVSYIVIAPALSEEIQSRELYNMRLMGQHASLQQLMAQRMLSDYLNGPMARRAMEFFGARLKTAGLWPSNDLSRLSPAVKEPVQQGANAATFGLGVTLPEVKEFLGLMPAAEVATLQKGWVDGQAKWAGATSDAQASLFGAAMLAFDYDRNRLRWNATRDYLVDVEIRFVDTDKQWRDVSNWRELLFMYEDEGRFFGGHGDGNVIYLPHGLIARLMELRNQIFQDKGKILVMDRVNQIEHVIARLFLHEIRHAKHPDWEDLKEVQWLIQQLDEIFRYSPRRSGMRLVPQPESLTKAQVVEMGVPESQASALSSAQIELFRVNRDIIGDFLSQMLAAYDRLLDLAVGRRQLGDAEYQKLSHIKAATPGTIIRQANPRIKPDVIGPVDHLFMNMVGGLTGSLISAHHELKFHKIERLEKRQAEVLGVRRFMAALTGMTEPARLSAVGQPESRLATVDQIGHLVIRLRNEYMVSPRLRLFVPQAAVYLHVPESVARQALNQLVQEKFLWETPGGMYMRRDGADREKGEVHPSVALLKTSALVGAIGIATALLATAPVMRAVGVVLIVAAGIAAVVAKLNLPSDEPAVDPVIEPVPQDPLMLVLEAIHDPEIEKAARLIWEKPEIAGLSPTVEAWEDGLGLTISAGSGRSQGPVRFMIGAKGNPGQSRYVVGMDLRGHPLIEVPATQAALSVYAETVYRAYLAELKLLAYGSADALNRPPERELQDLANQLARVEAGLIKHENDASLRIEQLRLKARMRRVEDAIRLAHAPQISRIHNEMGSFKAPVSVLAGAAVLGSAALITLVKVGFIGVASASYLAAILIMAAGALGWYLLYRQSPTPAQTPIEIKQPRLDEVDTAFLPIIPEEELKQATRIIWRDRTIRRLRPRIETIADHENATYGVRIVLEDTRTDQGAVSFVLKVVHREYKSEYWVIAEEPGKDDLAMPAQDTSDKLYITAGTLLEDLKRRVLNRIVTDSIEKGGGQRDHNRAVIAQSNLPQEGRDALYELLEDSDVRMMLVHVWEDKAEPYRLIVRVSNPFDPSSSFDFIARPEREFVTFKLRFNHRNPLMRETQLHDQERTGRGESVSGMKNEILRKAKATTAWQRWVDNVGLAKRVAQEVLDQLPGGYTFRREADRNIVGDFAQAITSGNLKVSAHFLTLATQLDEREAVALLQKAQTLYKQRLKAKNGLDSEQGVGVAETLIAVAGGTVMAAAIGKMLITGAVTPVLEALAIVGGSVLFAALVFEPIKKFLSDRRTARERVDRLGASLPLALHAAQVKIGLAASAEAVRVAVANKINPNELTEERSKLSILAAA
jgi:hypothetical protein